MNSNHSFNYNNNKRQTSIITTTIDQQTLTRTRIRTHIPYMLYIFFSQLAPINTVFTQQMHLLIWTHCFLSCMCMYVVASLSPCHLSLLIEVNVFLCVCQRLLKACRVFSYSSLLSCTQYFVWFRL